MKTLLLCLLAATLGAGELQPIGYAVKVDTIKSTIPCWVDSMGMPIDFFEADSGNFFWDIPERIITHDTLWVYPVVVDTIVRCRDTVKYWPISDTIFYEDGSMRICTLYAHLQETKCNTTYWRRP